MNNPLPAALTNVRRSRSIVDTGGLGSSRGAHISIRGGRFRIVSASGEETPVDEHYIDVLVCDMREVAARVYFDRPYVPGEDLPPACFSDNGTGPSTQAMAPQAPNCQMCPNNVRGTKTTFTGKPTTACETRRKLGVVLPDDPAVNVYEFQIPPGSLTNLKAYFDWIKMQASGVEGRGMDVADFITRVSFDPDRQFVMEFKPVAFADDDRSIALLKYIEENRLSDAAVGRNDVACDPEQVKLILAGSAQRQTIAAPNPAQAQARQEGQQFQLPPRGNGASLPAPAATPAASTPRSRSGCRGRASPTAPASATSSTRCGHRR